MRIVEGEGSAACAPANVKGLREAEKKALAAMVEQHGDEETPEQTSE